MKDNANQQLHALEEEQKYFKFLDMFSPVFEAADDIKEMKAAVAEFAKFIQNCQPLIDRIKVLEDRVLELELKIKQLSE